MSIERARKIMRVLQLTALMPMGQGWTKPTEIVTWSGVPHATVYRYLPKLAAQGFLHEEEYKCRELKCKRYRITLSGKNWIESLEIPF